jgi:pSer/pThr/pTyr-binding forkhead associated (FHA) protein
MPATVTLTVTTGTLKGTAYTFTETAHWLVGRSVDCELRMPSDFEYQTISRIHCILDIAPPRIWVRDRGSRNGTFVNGEKIGQRHRFVSATEGGALCYPERELHDGDELRIGDVTFRVNISTAAAETTDERSFADSDSMMVGSA